MGRSTKQNVLTSPERLAQVNPKNMRLKNDFLTYLKSTQRSVGTINGYSNDIDIFFVWLLDNADNKFYIDVTKRDLIAFQNTMMDVNSNSPARVRRVKAALSSLSNYIENILDDEFPDYRSIVRKIENPINQPVREKTVLTDQQVLDILNHFTNLGKYDIACMVALAASCGARKSELIRFKVRYFQDDNLVCDGTIWKTDERMKTKGRGLGKYIYKYVLVSTFKPYLDRWMKYREDNNIDSIWLFPKLTDTYNHIGISQMDSWADTISKFIGVPFYWHSVRHYCCTHLSNLNMPDSAIQDFFGWASQDMVGVYKDTDEDENIEKFFTSKRGRRALEKSAIVSQSRDDDDF